MVNGIHRRHDGEEHLSGADVGRGFVAADVLLAGAEREAKGGAALGVAGDADQAARHLAFVGVAGGEERGVRAAETEGDSKALGRADGDVGAELGGRTQQGEREQIGGDDAQRAGGVGGLEKRSEIVNTAGRVGVLDEHAEDVARGGEVERAVIAGDDGDAERRGAGADDVDRLRVAFFGDEEHAAVHVFDAMAEHHGLGGSGAFVEEGGVGDVESGEVGDDRLVIKQCFEAALGNLGLVGRVRGIPAGVLEDVTLDDGRRERVVVAHTDEAAEHLVLGGDGAEFGERGGFAEGGGELECALEADVLRDDGVDERVEVGVPEGGEHGGAFRSVGRDVAVGERVGRSEQLRERGGGRGGRRGSGHKKRTVGEAHRPANGFWEVAGVLGCEAATAPGSGETEGGESAEDREGGGLGNGGDGEGQIIDAPICRGRGGAAGSVDPKDQRGVLSGGDRKIAERVEHPIAVG